MRASLWLQTPGCLRNGTLTTRPPTRWPEEATKSSCGSVQKAMHRTWLPACIDVATILAVLYVLKREGESGPTLCCLLGGQTWLKSGSLREMTNRLIRSPWEVTIRPGGAAETTQITSGKQESAIAHWKDKVALNAEWPIVSRSAYLALLSDYPPLNTYDACLAILLASA